MNRFDWGQVFGLELVIVQRFSEAAHGDLLNSKINFNPIWVDLLKSSQIPLFCQILKQLLTY